MPTREAEEVVAFWREAGPDRWFSKDAAFDELIARRFGGLVEDAAAGRLAAWQDDATGALALVILTDQFPRNIYRGEARAFAADELARLVADRALAAGHDREVDADMRVFFYLPFTHSELLADQDRCVALCKATDDEKSMQYAILHRDLIQRFGQFPHRNAALGRKTTPEEADYLASDGFKG